MRPLESIKAALGALSPATRARLEYVSVSAIRLLFEDLPALVDSQGAEADRIRLLEAEVARLRGAGEEVIAAHEAISTSERGAMTRFSGAIAVLELLVRTPRAVGLFHNPTPKRDGGPPV